LTKQTLCEYFNDQLVKNEIVLLHIENIFKKYVNTPISEMNRAQANLLLRQHYFTINMEQQQGCGF